jgi:hypothetical protein
MKKRQFNKKLYDKYDKKAKLTLKKVIETNSSFMLVGDINSEHYKVCDLVFSKGDKTISFENEVRENFDEIITKHNTIHIPIRKKDNSSEYYVVWRNDFNQFIMIKGGTIKKYINNVVNILCKKEEYQDGEFEEKFIDIPKEETQWYVISEGLKLIKLDYH